MNVCCYGYPLCSCQDGDATTQTVVLAFPPIYSEIAAVFRIHERRDVIFSFGSRIYNPYGVEIPAEIIAHEALHGARQGKGESQVLDWWKRYMEDPTFRLVEEIHAHRVEYRWLLEHGNRRESRSALPRISAKLAGTLYGRLVTPQQARKLLLENENG